jgi:hypothetical protein
MQQILAENGFREVSAITEIQKMVLTKRQIGLKKC